MTSRTSKGIEDVDVYAMDDNLHPAAVKEGGP